MSEYPEHDKLTKVSAESQTIGEFLEWLEDTEKVHLARYEELEGFLGGPREMLTPYHYDISELMAKFFGIDLDKIEAEKRQMLDAIREMQKQES